MCEHEFIILATAELRSLVIGLGRGFSIRVCLRCSDLETRSPLLHDEWTNATSMNLLSNIVAADHQFRQRLQMLIDSVGRPRIGT